MINSETRNRVYRRGMILGWTLAEVFVLIVFALLFAIAAMMLREKRDAEAPANLRKATRDLQKATQKIAGLQEEIAYLREHLFLPNAFDDLYHELVLAQQQNAQLAAERDRLSKDDAMVSNLKHALERNGVSENDADRALAQLAQRSADAKRIEDALARDHLSLDQAGTLASREQQAQSEANIYRGQTKNLEEKISKLGGGTEMPACWADPTSGRIEYIFDVALRNDGILVHNNHLPSRVPDEKLLPLASLTFDKQINDDDFEDETSSLYSWSKEHGCRFFVRVFDETGNEQKETYKRRLNAVEGHFYKALQTGMPEWNAHISAPSPAA